MGLKPVSSVMQRWFLNPESKDSVFLGFVLAGDELCVEIINI